MIGDFNEITCSFEKLRGRPLIRSRIQPFLDFLEKAYLLDLGFTGPTFT